MRKRFGLAYALVALSVVLGSIVAGLAQERRPIVGGYKPADKTSEEVKSAAEFAAAEIGRKEGATVKLVSVENAESQVVAGKNYRLCMKVEVKGKTEEDDAEIEVQAVVYRNLQGKYSLTSWEEADCGGDDD